MKANINGIEIEGTPEEMKSFLGERVKTNKQPELTPGYGKIHKGAPVKKHKKFQRKPNSFKPITPGEVAHVIKTVKKEGSGGKVMRKLARELNRSKGSIINMCYRPEARKELSGTKDVKGFVISPDHKKHIGRKKGTKIKKLTQTEIDVVYKEFFKHNTTVKNIAKLIGRTTASVSNILVRLKTGKLNPTPTAVKTVNVGDETKVPKQFSFMG